MKPPKVCDICSAQIWGGSHYHCGRCRDMETTSMYGHWHSVHVIDRKPTQVEGHFSCEPGACESARRAS